MNRTQYDDWRQRNLDIVTAIHDYVLAQGALGKRTSAYATVERVRFETNRGIPNAVKPYLQRELVMFYPQLRGLMVVRG